MASSDQPSDAVSEQWSIITPDDVDDEGYAQSTNTSYLTSLSSSVRKGVQENGRTYASYGKNMQFLPIDDQEQQRNDMQHAKFLLLLNSRLLLSPISEAPQKILDLGTGSGIWAIDIADRYPSAQVIGVDIAPVQPGWVPPNCQFEIEDIEDDWLFPKDSFDLIYGRELMMTIRDWPRLIRQAYDRLKPHGYLELALTRLRSSCDDGSIDADKCFFNKAAQVAVDMGEKMGQVIDPQTKWKDQFAEVGLEDIHEYFFKVPIGPWAKDPRLKKIGVLELANVEEYESYLLRGFTQILGRTEAELRVMMADTRKEIFNPKHHLHGQFCVVYGRKPSR